MPVHTPPTKIIATRSYGATVILEGDTYDDAYTAAKKFSGEKNIPFIHAFNDDLIIAGQGTIGIEIYECLPDVKTVVVPVGGGGLISGITLALKHLKPDVEVIGVEAEGAQSMKLSLEQNKIVPLKSMSTIADGIAVKTPGELTYRIVHEYVDKVLTVNDEDIASTLYLLLQRAKLVVEPAGAVALAAILSKKIPVIKDNIVAIISGGNINLPLLTQVIERGMMKNKLLTRISLIVPDKTRMLRDILSILEKLRINVQGISHDRATTNVPIGYVNIVITFQTLGTDQIQYIEQELTRKKIDYQILK
jgi:threonine dehydratase